MLNFEIPMDVIARITEAREDYALMASTGHCGLGGFCFAMGSRLNHAMELEPVLLAAPVEAEELEHA